MAIRENESDATGFSTRLNVACEAMIDCPDVHKGRLGWLVEQYFKRTGEKLSIESVRKWTSGQSLPRPRRGEIIAEMLGVAPSWLYFGDSDKSPEFSVEAIEEKNNIKLNLDTSITLKLRPQVEVQITGIPGDLSAKEAQRLSRLILALTTSEE